MMKEEAGDIRYSIFDPTGNITALVESPVEIIRQPEVAAGLMKRHPEVEQVGFISFDPVPSLRMAGGEFCGNASMCAAARILMETGASEMKKQEYTRIKLRVSGADDPVEVDLKKKDRDSFLAGIHMPRAEGIKELDFDYGHMRDKLPVVLMGGISHIILSPKSPFASLKDDREAAESALRSWGDQLGHPGLGLMFLTPKKLPPEDSRGSSIYYDLKPLVYIPGSGTMFWEQSCASGSAAVGVYLAAKQGSIIDLTLQEPGGSLRVTSDPVKGETWLYGQLHHKQSLHQLKLFRVR